MGNLSHQLKYNCLMGRTWTVGRSMELGDGMSIMTGIGLRQWNSEGYSYLATKGTFKDFILTLQFAQKATGNSGVFFHSYIKGTKVNGWQAEIARPGHIALQIHQGGGIRVRWKNIGLKKL